MSSVFLKIVNMSITASWLILAVALVRLLLKKAPKWIPCLLWGLVAIRLVCPFSFGSIFSLIPSSETIPANITVQQEPAINSGITEVNDIINPVIAKSFAPVPTDSVNPLQIIIPVAAIVWVSGIVIMLAYALISYIKLKKTVSVCVPVGERILSCDEVKAPFILGVFSPIIYVPSSMSGETLDLVIRHETAHLQRHDHWWKPLGYLLLAIYWFNPLCWIAYILLSRDIEMACDEKVIRDMDKDEMAAYSQALLDCSFPRRRIAACPLAFGEVGVKERVKGVLNYKKPAFWIIVVAVTACIVIGVCFLTNPQKDIPDTLPLLHSHSYGVVEVTYENSGYDFSMVAQQNTPVYAITETMQLLSKGEYSSEEWTTLGTLTEIDLTKENFDNLFSGNGKWFAKNETAAFFRRNNANAWALIYREDVLYYVLQQKNGEVLLAYGYNDYSEKNDPYSDDSTIRWLYRLAFDIHEDAGIVVTSGENVIPVVVFPVGTPVSEMMDSVFWLDIAPGSDNSVPFTIYCDGNELYGQYSIYDAETMESLKFFMPSGLSPQTYLFQNAEHGHNYIVTLQTNEADILCFGARIGNVSPVSKDDPGNITIDIRTDVCELYLEVLEDLWNVDSGLNHGISQIGIDLSELSHLTELEKETVMHEFASKHNLPFIAGTWEELCEQGYIDKDNLYWEDGLFFSIKTNEGGNSGPEQTVFDAEKWRSGLGAYFFGQCTAQKNADGKWSYTVGWEAIS